MLGLYTNNLSTNKSIKRFLVITKKIPLSLIMAKNLLRMACVF